MSRRDQSPIYVWTRRARIAAKLPAQYVRSAVGARRGGSRFAEVESYCMFIGYPRSGHSLVGSLVSAHRHAVIGNEVDALRYVRLGFRREQIYDLILRSDAAFTARGRQAFVHNYEVAGQWQGRCERLRVIGDKKGGNSTWQLAAHPDLLERLVARVRDPLRVIHVTRNPYDNIGAIYRMPAWSGDLAGAARRYAQLAEGVADLRRRLAPAAILELRHEDLIAQPHATLRAVTEFLELDASADYLAACSAILYDEPNRVRDQVEWPAGVKEEVAAIIDRYDFLGSYSWAGV